MTLCVAWRGGNTFCMASDSCVTLGGGARRVYNGIKIVQVPVRVISPLVNNSFTTLFSSTYGIGMAGSFLTIYLVKELLADVLTHLQYIPPIRELTFERIAHLAFNVYRDALQTLTTSIDRSNDTDIFLMGTCPATNAPQAVKFYRHSDNTLRYEMILRKEPVDYDVSGSGSESFHKRIEPHLHPYNPRLHHSMLRTLKDVIEFGDIASVGGSVQYGEITPTGPFEVNGVVDRYKDKDCGIRYKATVRGTDIESVCNAETPKDLLVYYTYVRPYEDDVGNTKQGQ